MKLRLATRGSKLALAQARGVADELMRRAYVETDLVVVETTGDVLSERPLDSFDDMGVFHKEVDIAVVDGRADFAVHSMKDLPTLRPLGTVIAAVPRRASPHDVMVTRDGAPMRELAPGSVVGTGSPRRTAQVLSARPDLKVVGIRGNVDTRLRKLGSGDYDAIVLAEAGLERLRMAVPSERLPLETFTPSPGQGALAIVAAEERPDIAKVLSALNDRSAVAEVAAERAFMAALGGGCSIPMGAVARAGSDGRMSMLASVLSPDGRRRVDATRTGRMDQAESLGERTAAEMLGAIVRDIPGWGDRR